MQDDKRGFFTILLTKYQLVTDLSTNNQRIIYFKTIEDELYLQAVHNQITKNILPVLDFRQSLMSHSRLRQLTRPGNSIIENFQSVNQILKRFQAKGLLRLRTLI